MDLTDPFVIFIVWTILIIELCQTPMIFVSTRCLSSSTVVSLVPRVPTVQWPSVLSACALAPSLSNITEKTKNQ